MEKENKTSLSLERIEQFETEIQNTNKDKKNKFLARTFFFVILLVSLCLLPFLPPFSCKNMTLTGAFHLKKQDVLKLGGYNFNTPLIFVDDQKIEKELNNLDFILSSNVKWSFVGLEVEVNELACLLQYEDSLGKHYILSNGTLLEDFLTSNETDYDFKEDETPILISDFSFENKDNDEEQSNLRKQKLLNNLKLISPSVLSKAKYFEIVYNSSSSSLYFGFYFMNDNEYYRILMRDEAFSFFLEEKRFNQIINVISNTSNKIIYNHATINMLSYSNTICGYDGSQNVCRVNVNNGEEAIYEK